MFAGNILADESNVINSSQWLCKIKVLYSLPGKRVELMQILLLDC